MMVTMSSPPSPPPIRVASVGAGAISQSQHVPGLQLDPRAELVMVCDTDPPSAYACQLEWGAKRMAPDFREVCSSPDVDALIVATPNDTHVAVTLAAVEQGKHVLCEKPLGRSAGEVREMVFAALRDPSEVDDSTSIIGHFESGAVGVWEGTTLAKGHHHGGFGHEWFEINGSEGTAVYRLHRPHQLWRGSSTRDLAPEEVPPEFLVTPGSPRDPQKGDPATVFRYDVVWEFLSAIHERRGAVPDFYDGLAAQIVADAVLQSHQDRSWVAISPEPRG